MNETKCNGKFVFIPGACPNCGELDSMRISHLDKYNKLNTDEMFFRCLICKDTKEYDWWVLWSYVIKAENEKM